MAELSRTHAGLFASQDLTFKGHFSDIEAITKEVGERPAGERNATDGLSRLQRAHLRDDASFVDRRVNCVDE